MTIQAWGPMRSNNGFFPNDDNLSDENAKLQKWGNEFGISKEAMAIAWLMKLDFVQPIIGTTNTARLKEIIKADEVELSRQQWYNVYNDMGNLVP
jgi:predicted oxidoreductase